MLNINNIFNNITKLNTKNISIKNIHHKKYYYYQFNINDRENDKSNYDKYFDEKNVLIKLLKKNTYADEFKFISNHIDRDDQQWIKLIMNDNILSHLIRHKDVISYLNNLSFKMYVKGDKKIAKDLQNKIIHLI